MYKRFAFEGDIHQALDCVPLTVRRKLDLAGLKISLEGWQALGRPERLSLCHLPVESEWELAVYGEVLRGFCERAGVALKPLADPEAQSRAWNVPAVPERVGARVKALGARLDDRAWAALDEESRYALLKLSDPKRDNVKIGAALIELGLLAGEARPLSPAEAVCSPGSGPSPAPGSGAGR